MDYKKIVLNWFRGNDFLYWRMLNAENEVVGKVEDDDLTADEALAKLAMNLDTLPSGLYKLKARKKKADANGEVIHNFYVESAYTPASAPKVTGNDDEIARLKAKNEALEKALTKHETDKLVRDIEAKWEKKFEKLQESQSSQPNMIEQITGLMGLLSQGKMPFSPAPQVQPITGAPHQQQQPTNDQETRNANPNANANMIIQTALGQMRRIFQDDNSFLYFMQSVGNIAEHEPNKFMMILQFLPKPQTPQSEPQPTETEE